MEITAKKRTQMALENAKFEDMCAIPRDTTDLLEDPIFMTMSSKIHVDDDLKVTDIKSSLLQLIWTGQEDDAIILLDKL